jgi:hypothetical protein
MTPCRLDEGILLENDGSLLPWGTPLAELVGLAGSVVTTRHDRIQHHWHDRTCLGGLPCRVYTTRLLDEPHPAFYHLYLDHLHSAVISLIEPRLDEATMPEDFRRVLAHLEGQLGPVMWSHPRYAHGLPSALWEFPRLRVSFRAGEVAFLVSFIQEPEHTYKELRDEAAWIRPAGKGRRVEGIAW